MPKEKIPTSHQTHPPDLATTEELKREGLQPADHQRVAALFKLQTSTRELLTGLYRRSEAVPLQIELPESTCAWPGTAPNC